MANVKFVENKNGVSQLLNGSGAMQAVTQHATEIQGRASGMFGASNYGLSPARPGKTRCHAIVYTGDKYAVNSNRLHNTLLKSLS